LIGELRPTWTKNTEAEASIKLEGPIQLVFVDFQVVIRPASKLITLDFFARDFEFGFAALDGRVEIDLNTFARHFDSN
jgi:hypothetical protein